jgi:hypothetical protein
MEGIWLAVGASEGEDEGSVLKLGLSEDKELGYIVGCTLFDGR